MQGCKIMRKPTILITGVTGQVGGALVRRLARFNIIACTRQNVDLTCRDDIVRVINSTMPDLVINPAAYTAVDRAESEPTLAHSINTEAPYILANEVKRHKIPMIHFSTDYVFSGEGEHFRNELAETGPINVYGKSKLDGEKAVLDSGAEAVVLRTSWVFSSYGHNFLKTMLRLSYKDQLSVVNDQIGSPTSANMLALSVAQIVELGLVEGFKSYVGVYHLCNAGITSWKGFAEEIFRQANQQGLIQNTPIVRGILTSDYPTPAARPLNSRLDCAKFEQVFGIKRPTWQQDVATVIGEIKKDCI